MSLEFYKVVPILKKLPLDIECINAYDDYLIVGTKQGHLLMYKLKAKTGPELKFDVHILRSNKAFAKKPIVQIEALPEFHILVSLSENQISVHSLDPINSPLIPCNLLANRSKGATLFVTNICKYKALTGEEHSVLRLCVVVRHKLSIFYWKNNDFHELASDLVVPDTPRTIAWIGESLCVGFRSEYMLIKVTGEQKELFALGNHHPEPMVAAIEGGRLKDQLLALGRDEKTYILDAEGNPFLSHEIGWSGYPQTIVSDSPYLVALLPNSVVEIQTIDPSITIQKINNFSSQTQGKIKQIVKCGNKKGNLFVCSNNDVLCLVSIPSKEQIPLLIQEGHFELALELASSSNQSSGEGKEEDVVKQIENLHAFDLFCRKEFKEAMNMFSRLDTDPPLVIGLLPDLLPEETRRNLEYPNRPPPLDSLELKSALTALIDYLLQIRRKLSSSNNTSSSSSNNTSSSASSSSNNKSSNNKSNNNTNSSTDASLDGDGRRKKHQLWQIVDTTLVKCYLETSDALVASLLRLPDNQCHLEETEKALNKYGKFNELIILYHNKKLHRKALEMLREQSKKTGSPFFGQHRTVHYLQQLGPDSIDIILQYSEWVIRDHPEDGFRIFTEDVSEETERLPRDRVLAHLERVNPDLVIPYLEHVIHVWKDSTGTFHNKLIYKYKENVIKLLVPYLKELGNQSPAPAGSEPGKNRLGNQSSAPAGSEPGKNRLGNQNQSSAPAGSEPGNLGELRKKLLDFLLTSDSYSTELLPSHLIQDGLWDELAIVMGKMGDHQEALSIYVNKLQDLKKAEEYCQRVYDRSHQRNREVFLILLQLYLSPSSSSSSSSSTSCAKLPSAVVSSSMTRGDGLSSGAKSHVGSNDKVTDNKFADNKVTGNKVTGNKITGNKVTSNKVTSNSVMNIDAAIKLMNDHASQMDPLRALYLLPASSTSVSSIRHFLETVSKQMLSERREGQLFRNLLLSQHLSIQGQRIRMQQSHKIVIEDGDLCTHCQKRIGRSAFLRFPNNHLVHYSCKDRYNMS